MNENEDIRDLAPVVTGDEQESLAGAVKIALCELSRTRDEQQETRERLGEMLDTIREDERENRKMLDEQFKARKTAIRELSKIAKAAMGKDSTEDLQAALDHMVRIATTVPGFPERDHRAGSDSDRSQKRPVVIDVKFEDVIQ
jgi:hypothetical protein